jgi:hypothetical protein
VVIDVVSGEGRKIGTKVIAYAPYTIFQVAEMAVPSDLFQHILKMIDDLRPRPAPWC